MKLLTIASVALNLMVVSGIAIGGTLAIQDHQEEEFAEAILQDTLTRQMQELQAKAMECLALNIYFETMAVSLADGVAVSDVVMNRVKDSRYPNTICEVVKQGHKHENGQMKRHKCQFSWYCDGKADVPTNAEAWERSRKLARDIYLHKAYVGITEGATHYHANYVKPKWRLSLDRTTRVGSHIFYRQK